MFIEIDGSRCISCAKYTQYYAPKVGTGELVPINCGRCGQRQCTTQPGNRGKYYRERSNVGPLYRVERVGKTTKRSVSNERNADF